MKKEEKNQEKEDEESFEGFIDTNYVMDYVVTTNTTIFKLKTNVQIFFKDKSQIILSYERGKVFLNDFKIFTFIDSNL